MLCDDSLMVIKKMTDTLKALGIKEVITATDGVQAVALYKLRHPDIVFMDQVMPNKTGLEALAEIIALDPNAKVFMLSSVGTLSKREEARKIGAQDFIQKPVEIASVKEALEQIAEYKLQNTD
ncbi:MAG: response regulator [Ruminococcus sp.]|nr:response regulator [Ruminococcus sp.]